MSTTPSGIPVLPIPPLDQTLDRYLATVRPLLADDAYATTEQAVAALADGDGPACQQALEAYAQKAAEAGRSWLADPWLDGYLDTRTPLPLASNVDFQIAWPSTQGVGGIERAADVVSRLAAVHLSYLRGEVAEDLSPRGTALAMEQWAYLAGGLRQPGHGRDAILPGDSSPSNREIIVLDGPRAWAVPISDAQGQPVSQEALAATLARIQAAPRGPAEGGGALPFSAVTYLGSERAAEVLGQMSAEEANRATLQRLGGALFFASLGAEEAEPLDRLLGVLLEPGLAWAYAPITYHVSLVDDYVSAHVEHSQYDAGVLETVIGRAHALDPLHDDRGLDTAGQPDELAWELTPELADTIREGVADYREGAAGLQVARTVAAAPTVMDPPFRVSLDGMAQLTMLYAQVATFGEVRSTYESVDMREYAAGRTEALRPNSQAAVALARALVAGTATSDLLRAALDQHRTSVKWCKQGQAIDRHLFGLAMAAEQEGLTTPLHDDEGFRRLTGDFLSTTSIGSPERIVRYVFAPSIPDGLGINYTPVADGMEFTITYDQRHHADLAPFLEALREGYRRVWELVGA